ncbi:MAG: nitrate reductase, partial [Nevskiaceae bacterium]
MSTSAPVRTTCPYCGVGCGVLASPRADGGVDIAGDPTHGASLGRLCVKGSALGETVGLEERLLYPELRAGHSLPRSRGRAGVGASQPVNAPLPTSPHTRGEEPAPRRRASWNEALDTVAEGFARIIAEHGPDAVAFYVSGQLLTEDYYLANKLMKGYIGSANIDTNSRLCMSSAVAGHKRAFGEDLVPGCYEDFETAELVVLVGSNTAWCHPVLFQRLSAAKQARPELQIVVIDPRRTASCELADLHLPLAPGSDVALFNGLLAWLHQQGLGDAAFLAEHARGAEAAVAVALETSGSLAHVARACGLPEPLLRQFYALWGRSEKVV